MTNTYSNHVSYILNELLNRTTSVRQEMGKVYEDSLMKERASYQNPDWTRIEGAVKIEDQIRKMIKEIEDGAST